MASGLSLFVVIVINYFHPLDNEELLVLTIVLVFLFVIAIVMSKKWKPIKKWFRKRLPFLTKCCCEEDGTSKCCKRERTSKIELKKLEN